MVAILWISLLCAESFHMNKCVEIERLALLKFKDAYIHGMDNPFASWKGEDCCKWKGILCDNITGHIISLKIEHAPGLGGKLVSSICELQHLTSLSLDDNQLEGNIPECIGSLAQLIEVNLASNKLVRIPPSLGNLSNLQTLDLAYNYDMIVDWLSSISRIPSLSELISVGCGLHNITPSSLPHLNSSISLKSLDLGENNLNSSILPWVINVSKVLETLVLSYNSLQQSIPYEFGNMFFLQYLDLSHNELQGSLPKSYKSMYQLKELHLNSNKLSGQLSDSIQQLCCANNSLEYLDLSDNPFTSDPLPNLSCVSSLVTLSLQNTNLVGLLPKWLFVHSPFLQNLYLSHNHLRGVDIIDDANLSAIRKLHLSFNQLSGPFPHIISQLPNLEELSISSNKFNDIIDKTHLSNLSKLKFLDVSQNSLSFNLSSDWIPPFKLTNLYASSCQLGLEFPVWLKHQTELTEFDISNTGISDSFPKWFWNLSLTLEYLNVSHNKLNGPMPKSFPNTKVNYDSFYVWDFSFNHLNGSLPPFPELRSLFLSNNMLIGSLSSFCTSSGQYLIYLDLSSNLLTGKLTDCYWEKFPSLTFLNLAKNNLSGKVPTSFGVLRHIESLHLNNNNLSGEIPSLILCHNLKLIDVGDNNLQGTLPMWMGDHLPMLIVIILRANKFHGNIPTNIFQEQAFTIYHH
ncbi:receptor-like protein EIX1 [Vicia villosa]|uniref:receptor-like protein EIX1 n=1 Tax=Vicia villosa TaxID=3911 RepID=UPI00273B84D2|nr:receptor-like protein EIX1 [Vicia villosa]